MVKIHRKELKKKANLAAEEADIREEDVLKEKDAFEDLKKLAAKSLTETVNQLIDTVNQVRIISFFIYNALEFV